MMASVRAAFRSRSMRILWRLSSSCLRPREGATAGATAGASGGTAATVGDVGDFADSLRLSAAPGWKSGMSRVDSCVANRLSSLSSVSAVVNGVIAVQVSAVVSDVIAVHVSVAASMLSECDAVLALAIVILFLS